MLLEISLIFASKVRRHTFIPGNFLLRHKLKMQNISFRCSHVFEREISLLITLCCPPENNDLLGKQP